MTKPKHLLFASDIHFGVPNIYQEDMTKVFGDIIFPLLENTDLFFINGDFFHDLVPFDQQAFDPIYDVIIHLLEYCDAHGVTLRILQGTWTHDRNQCHRIANFYTKGKFGFPFRFVEGIGLGDRSLRVLYIPDDLPFKSSDAIMNIVDAKMVEKGWDWVDYTCMHGFFDFTLGKGASTENRVVFRREQFPFVRKLVNVGHVHQYQVEENVFSNGSFDRLVFGDESPKGLIRVMDYPDHYTAQFIENKDAAIFDTLVFSKKDTTESIRVRISDHLATLDSWRPISLRCVIEQLDHRDAIKDWMRGVYPQVKLKIKTDIDREDRLIPMINTALLAPVETPVVPTEKTIASFIQSHLPANYSLSLAEIDMYLTPPTP